MDDPRAPQPAPSHAAQPSKPETWVIILVVVFVLCCCMVGVTGLIIAFGPEILGELGI